ncbi:unnamed protein product, partial [Penicillium olsonii]
KNKKKKKKKKKRTKPQPTTPPQTQKQTGSYHTPLPRTTPLCLLPHLSNPIGLTTFQFHLTALLLFATLLSASPRTFSTLAIATYSRSPSIKPTSLPAPKFALVLPRVTMTVTITVMMTMHKVQQQQGT